MWGGGEFEPQRHEDTKEDRGRAHAKAQRRKGGRGLEAEVRGGVLEGVQDLEVLVAALMHFLTAQAFRRAKGGQRTVRFPMIEGPPVLGAQSHLAFEHLADQPGD